jgi:uncharacterized protein (TIGR02145 family)
MLTLNQKQPVPARRNIMNKTKFISLKAGLALATALNFSCGEHDGFFGLSENSSSSNEAVELSSGGQDGSSLSGSDDPSSSSYDGGQLSSSSEGEHGLSSSDDTEPESSSSYAIIPIYGEPITDTRDGKTYKTVVIGTQTWMAENLNYDVADSKCYGDGGKIYDYDEESKDLEIKMPLTEEEVQDYCQKHGRLYDWSTAMAFPPSCNDENCPSYIQAKHKGICPDDWHIPSNDDWDKLLRYVDWENNGDGTTYNSQTAGRYLKAEDGWNDYEGESGNGTDKYGFSALPGGYGSSNGSFFNDGRNGVWWSASEREHERYYAYNWYMYHDSDRANRRSSNKGSLLSVRCLLSEP